MSSSVLDVARQYLRDHVRPNAERIDQDVDALKQALQGMCDLNLMSLRRPVEYGGPDLSEDEFRQFQQEVARASGALAFLQTQHQTAVKMIASSPKEGLKAELLPRMGNGQLLMGIGFSQLRRPGPPVTRAKKADGGYRLEGLVPWVTGWSLYSKFVVGAMLENGEALYGILPLPLKPEIGMTPSEAMRLAAMESAQTVSIELNDVFMPEEAVMFIREPGFISQSDLINIALQGHYAVGCAQAGIDIVRDAAVKKPAAAKAADRLQAELDDMATQLSSSGTDEASAPERLKLRAWAIELAVRCAHAAIAATGGSANSVDHPAQRVYREALVYTVSAQTGPIMEATLDRLVR